jgi:PAS domain S-box-containing protein
MRKLRTSLISRLIVSFLGLSLLTVVLVGALSYSRARAMLIESVNARLNAILDVREESLNRWVQERITDLFFISKLPQVQLNGRILIKEGIIDEAAYAYVELQAFFRTLLSDRPDFSEILILARSGGEVVLSSDVANEGDFRVSDTYFTRGLEGSFIQNVYLSPTIYVPTMTLSTPILDEGGRSIGVLAVHLNLQHFDEIILGATGLGKTGEIYVVDSTNTFVSAKGFGRADYPRGAHSLGIEKAIADEKGNGLYRNYAGTPVVGAYRWLPERSLAMIGEISQSEAFLPARQLAIQIAFIGAFISLLLTGAVNIVARRIASPVLAITEAARRISAGERDIQAPVLSDDEVGELARTFNFMVKDIRENEEKFRNIFMTSPDSITISRVSDSVVVDVNAGFTALTGYDRTEILGKSILTLYGDDESREPLLITLAEHGEAHNFEALFRIKDGTERTGLSSARIITLAEEQFVLSITKDITELKEYERTLAESEEKYRLLAENVSDVIWVWDENLKPVYYSPSILQLRGFTSLEAIQQSLEQFLTPASLKVAQELIARELQVETKEKEVPSSQVLTTELEMFRKDGSTIWTEVSMRILRDEDGKVTGVTGVTRNINRRKIAERALKESEERYRILFNSGSDAVFVHGIADDGTPGEFYTVNEVACQMLGMSREDLMEKTPADIVPAEAEKGMSEMGKKVLEEKRTVYESRLVDSRGNEIPVEMSISLIDLYDSPVAVTIARDLTERKKMEEEREKVQAKLIQANKMTSLGLMVSSLGHEINNPNNTIMFNLRRFAKTWVDIMPILDEYYDENGDFNLGGMPYSELKDVFPMLVSGTLESSEMIKAIIENLKGFVRQSSDAMDFDVDVSDVVRRAVTLLESQVRKGVGRLEMELAENLPRVKGNPQKLIQVMVNLISNALESISDDEQKVLARTGGSDSEPGVFMEVVDEGIGMSVEQIERMFEPFYSTKLESGGTGLGMTIARMLLDEHGARLDIESVQGEGTRVTVTLLHDNKDPDS